MERFGLNDMEWPIKYPTDWHSPFQCDSTAYERFRWNWLRLFNIKLSYPRGRFHGDLHGTLLQFYCDSPLGDELWVTGSSGAICLLCVWALGPPMPLSWQWLRGQRSSLNPPLGISLPKSGTCSRVSRWKREDVTLSVLCYYDNELFLSLSGSR